MSRIKTYWNYPKNVPLPQPKLGELPSLITVQGPPPFQILIVSHPLPLSRRKKKPTFHYYSFEKIFLKNRVRRNRSFHPDVLHNSAQNRDAPTNGGRRGGHYYTTYTRADVGYFQRRKFITSVQFFSSSSILFYSSMTP